MDEGVGIELRPTRITPEMEGARIEGRSDIRELQVLGDWAYIRGYLEIAMTPPGGNTVRRSGYTLTIFRKQADGRWLLARDAYLLTAGAS